MANRKATIIQDELKCPGCSFDYSNTKLVERFLKVGNKVTMSFSCDCKRRLVIRHMVNFIKIYDVTEIRNKQNLKAKMDRIKSKQNGAI
jgi:hypothetical protein